MIEQGILQNVSNVLPDKKLKISIDSYPSMNVTRNGFNYSKIKTNISGNDNSIITPMDEVDYDLYGLWKTSLNSASKNPEKNTDLFFPKHTEDVYVYPVQDPKYYEDELVKHAKIFFGFAPSQDITQESSFIENINKKKDEIENEYKKKIEKMTSELEIMDQYKKNQLNIFSDNINSINREINDLKAKNIENASKITEFYGQNINLMKEITSNNTMTAQDNQAKKAKIDNNKNAINTLKEEIKQNKNKIKVLEIDKRNFDYESNNVINEYIDSLSKLDKEKELSATIPELYKILVDYYNKRKSIIFNAKLEEEKKKQKGGYQVRSKKGSVKRGGYRVKSKRSSIKRGGTRKSKTIKK
jgi:polyhydroxyalkanoate synthesis regulator phasin